MREKQQRSQRSSADGETNQCGRTELSDDLLREVGIESQFMDIYERIGGRIKLTWALVMVVRAEERKGKQMKRDQLLASLSFYSIPNQVQTTHEGATKCERKSGVQVRTRERACQVAR